MKRVQTTAAAYVRALGPMARFERTPGRRIGTRAGLLLGSSLIALAVADIHGANAQAVSALMNASHQVLNTITAPAVSAAQPSGPATPAGMAAASARALRYQTQVNSATSLAQQAQAAAQAAARALNQNQLAGIADGLQPGGLQPAVSQITPANSDATGRSTWQGAALPTAGADPNSVTVVQTDPRAILSWKTFNVGQNTSLTFQQQQNGVDRPDWVVLNRVVGASTAPATILGSVKAPGTVLVLNQNGILFGPTSQVKVGSLIASALEIGHEVEPVDSPIGATSLQTRNTEFLSDGLLGYAQLNKGLGSTFSEMATFKNNNTTNIPAAGQVQVLAGASLTAADGGFLMLLGPSVVNAGALTANGGEVVLQAGGKVTLTASTGDANSIDPDVRGLVATSTSNPGDVDDTVLNSSAGIIQAQRGYVALGSATPPVSNPPPSSGVTHAGVILSTTSVSENGYVSLSGDKVTLSPGAVIAVGPDSDQTTIPQDATSLASFKPSRVRIGGAIDPSNATTTTTSLIDIGRNSLIYAPGGNISIGADPGETALLATTAVPLSNVTIEADATIDAAGLTDVSIPASRNTIKIDPVKGNELANSPAFRSGFLNGSTVYLDPRLSGVNANGVAWVGSPLISAGAYAQQVGVSVSELMVAGGNVTLGVLSAPAGAVLQSAGVAGKKQVAAPQVVVSPGATIDIAGGWKTYEAGYTQQSYLITTSGQAIPISQANPDATYLGLYTGFAASQPRWGVTRTYADPLLAGPTPAGQYTEGRDGGSFTLTGSVIALDGQVFAGAFAGAEQLQSAVQGTKAPSVFGDNRALQGAPSQLPVGGYLDVQALGLKGFTGGGDIVIEGSGSYKAGPSTVISLNADALSGMGLGQLTVQTSGALSLTADAALTLPAGGRFEALAGRAITIDGSITAPSGAIDLTTADIAGGSVFTPLPKSLPDGSFDINVNGRLSVAGLWVNDFTAPAGQLSGPAYLKGGEITLDAAPRVTAAPDQPSATAKLETAACAPASTGCTDFSTDVSGSILIAPGALLDATGGGYVKPSGGFALTAKGGDVSLYDDTTYFQLAVANTGQNPFPTDISGFRVSGLIYGFDNTAYVPINPVAVTARVTIPDGTIRAQGFGGGGTFTLTTPQFSFGSTPTPAGAVLPLDFFSKAGFAAYNITAYDTYLFPNTFYQASGTYGGNNAIPRTDVAIVGAGQTLTLAQSYFSPLLNAGQIAALQALPTGSNLASATDQNGHAIVSASVQTDAWDQKPISLTLGGLTELHVAPGGQVTGAAGAALTTGGLFNEGVIRLPGGTITQSLVMPAAYGDSTPGQPQQPVGISSLSQAFLIGSDGKILESAASTLDSTKPNPRTNLEVAQKVPLYLLGDLDPGEGVKLAPGSVTDLSGAAIVNPRARAPSNTLSAGFTDGKIVDGGSLISTDVFQSGKPLFRPTYEASDYPPNLTGAGLALTLTAQPGSTIDLSGAQATFDKPVASGSLVSRAQSPGFAPTPVWSNGGNLTLDSGGTITGAVIRAQGGAPSALGGVLTVLDPILYQSDPSQPTPNEIAADMITNAGFSSFVAEHGLTNFGPVTLHLPRSLFVETPTRYQIFGLDAQSIADAESPVIGLGGRLEIDAPYIALDGAFQSVSVLTPPIGNPDDPKTGGKTFNLFLNADAIDISGAVIFDRTILTATLSSTGDVRLIGVPPSSIGLLGPPPATLEGEVTAWSRTLTINAAQVYPTTGSNFFISDHLLSGTINFTSPGGAPPPVPYSAGGSLTVQAVTINQGGVLRAPLGSLTLGGNTPLMADYTYLPADQKVINSQDLAPPTKTLTLLPGSISSVSADGLDIPYGTTTDQKEWYFTPTNSSQLTAPPAGVLHLASQSISVANGATVDLSGGGDVYAYEFVPGTGGTRDVLDRFNPDQFSSTNGYQYPDKRQVYAIVPGLSDAQVAALDPLYSSDYGSLYSPTQAGLRVYVNTAPGLTAGWYTLLPAKYALLPGGMRLVQDTTAATPPAGAPGTVLADGTIVATGNFGVAGTNARSSSLNVFDIQSQAVFRTESNIALTYGNATFAANAAHSGDVLPQLPIDAGRLILDPRTALNIAGAFLTTPAKGGRGSEVDITGTSLVIDPAASAPPVAGAIVLTDASLNSLNASSLLLGGIRTDNADGTTSLAITTSSIAVNTGAALSAPEIVMATDGVGASLTVADGASITALGAVTKEPAGAYSIEGLVTTVDSSGEEVTNRVLEGQGAVLRVSNGPERLVTRSDVDTTIAAGALQLGAVALQGASVELNSLGALTLSDRASIRANTLAVTTDTISFGAGGQGLVITPALQALFGQAGTLTLQSPHAIGFAGGTYAFGDVLLDSPGLADANGGSVTLTAGALTLANSFGTTTACGLSGALACGGGDLTVNAKSITFGSGAIAATGFGKSVTLKAAQGVFAGGAATFDAGSAVLALNTPFLGDEAPSTTVLEDLAAGKPIPVQPSLALTSTVTNGAAASKGAISLASATPASAFTAPSGVPGSKLTIDGASVAIQGTELRATAGLLDIKSASGIAISGGAVLAAPAYAQAFGDSADPALVSAPGGLLRLTAASGDIGVSDDSRLSIGGAQGQAGSLALAAPNGQVFAYHGAPSNAVALASVLSVGAPGAAPLSGASLTLQTGGSFDLAGFVSAVGQSFTGDLNISTGRGDLALNAGQTLKATSLSLTADGGQIADAGTIDTSGVNGGDVSLYGAGGVHLFAGAAINAEGAGYGLSDTRQAHGGNVVLGLGGAGAITVDSGAAIDVTAAQTAAHPGDRLVQLDRSNGSYYSLVAADIGGTVTFRAPVINGAGGDTVAVAVHGAVNGASSVTLEGVKTFDLQTLASNPAYVGVKTFTGAAAIAQGCPSIAACAVLDLGAVGGVNALGYDTDLAGNPVYANGKIVNGPVVDFVQKFNVSADYGALSGLAALPNFRARPGIELGFAGDIVLASNWNLGAGVVNVADAVAAKLMTPIAALPGQYAVVPGAEGRILALPSTVATYRVGGTFSGEPGDLAIRAGGSLTLNGSITDGFFQFRDQTNPQYLAAVTDSKQFQAYLTTSCTGGVGACNRVRDWTGAVPTGNAVIITFPAASQLSTNSDTPLSSVPDIPYSAMGNSPAAQGSLGGGGGDSLGSADVFPLLPGGKAVGSWSYQLVGGAGAAGGAVRPSANPLTTLAGADGGVTVQGYHVYSYGGDSFTGTLTLADNGSSPFATIQDWLDDLEATFDKIDPNSNTTLRISTAPTAVRTLITSEFESLYAPSQYSVAANGNINTTLTNAVDFLTVLSNSFTTAPPGGKSLASYYAQSIPGIPSTYATAPTLVRTGTGSISIAAAGNIDLSNDHLLPGYSGPTTLNAQGLLVPTVAGGAQLGGAAVYTAGRIVELGSQSAPVTETATDFATGSVFTVTLNNGPAAADNFAQAGAYLYGLHESDSINGYAGILIANPVSLAGGGNVALSAGGDVLGRRDTYREQLMGLVGNVPDIEQDNFPWIGPGNQPWRTGAVGAVVNAKIDPQLFGEGVGALGGGDISLRAGGNVSDLSIVSTDTLSTGCAATSCDVGGTGSTLVTLGGGAINVAAGGSLLGGRLDVASGAALVKVQGDVASAGRLQEMGTVDNTLRVRLSDATVEIDAGGSAALQGVAALGVGRLNLFNTFGFYSPTAGFSLVAGGGVSLVNGGYDLIAPGDFALQADLAAVYPGSFKAISFTGGLGIGSPSAATEFSGQAAATETILAPSPTGTLTLMAGASIAPTVVAQEDADPTLLPGAFTDSSTIPSTGLPFTFPIVLSNTSDTALREMHAATPTHTGDDTPNRIAAGGDINDLILATAKQTRVAAGRDIVNMVFLGQNVDPNDVTRITAGRDITATTTLASPVIAANSSATLFGAPLPTLQGDTFVLGGPGALFVEAGRDAGPFLNSAVTDGFAGNLNSGGLSPIGVLTYGGGILTVGNLWNPALPAQGADIYTSFGVGKGQNFAGLVSTYLNPTNFGNLPDYLFLQTTDAAGLSVADRTHEIYALSLVDWMKAVAPEVISRYDTAKGVTAPPADAPAFIQFLVGLKNGGTATTAQALPYLAQLSTETMPLVPWMQLHEGSALMKQFGTLDVTYQQAFNAFNALPQVTQHEFLIKDVYFNELVQTSVPASPSYLKYSRGYQAVNSLFPAADGYTANSLAGGPAGASAVVDTGNLDLRLATIQTAQGGDISILGPGGRVLAGSTVSTQAQAARRAYDGGRFYSGDTLSTPVISTITSVPSGYEGVLTLNGGSIFSFTDGDFLLNQSRAFTVRGGDIAIWSSNADVNAGQGPRTTPDVPPLVVRIDANGFTQVNANGAVSGAGIAAFGPNANDLSPDVFLIAPRGTVDAGAAGVRSAGSVFIAAFQVANADNVRASGTISGIQGPAAVNVSVQTSGDAAASAAAAAAQAAASTGGNQNQRPVIFVDVLGFLGDEPASGPNDDQRRGRGN
jgi:filamentous hemagglutinin family protein